METTKTIETARGANQESSLQRFRRLQKEGGFRRVDCWLTPEAFEILIKHSEPWESLGATLSRLMVTGSSPPASGGFDK